MKTSDNGIDLIAGFEGFSSTVYSDVGHPAWGYGHDQRPGEPLPTSPITEADGRALLAQDVSIAESAVNGNVQVTMTQRQFDACVSLAYNIGGGAFATSSVCRLLNASDVAGAADAFLLWDKSMHDGQLVVNPTLARRRSTERLYFMTPDTTAAA